MKKSTMLALVLNAAVFTAFGYVYGTYDEDVSAVSEPAFIVSPHVSELEMYIASISEEEKYCLAQNVYFEARNQSIRGQRAVARVTLNRVDSSRYPDTICEVVWQNRQFSWTHDGLSDVPGGNAIEDRAWELAQSVAMAALVNHFVNRYDPTYGATHYHANYVNPYWAHAYEEVAVVGDHIFYR